jgi:hypothetical protein
MVESWLNKLTSLFKIHPSPDVSEWFTVQWDDKSVSLDARPPSRKPWTANFKWSDIQRVCFKAEDITCSDGICVFTSDRPESWVIPTEAKGGQDFLNELIERELFDAELLIKASCATEGIFCWTPSEKEGIAFAEQSDVDANCNPALYQLRDITAQFRNEMSAGKGRWIFTVLAVISFAGLMLSIFDPEAAAYFPIMLKGTTLRWIVGFSLLLWTSLAVHNWIMWARSRKT